MSQDGFVFTWDPPCMAQGRDESEDTECHKMALNSPGTPVAWPRDEMRTRTQNVARWLFIHLGPPLHGPGTR